MKLIQSISYQDSYKLLATKHSNTLIKPVVLYTKITLPSFFILVLLCLLLSACGNPGGISDTDYETFKQLSAPKILFSCTHFTPYQIAHFAECMQDPGPCVDRENEMVIKKVEIGYVAGVGAGSTYNSLLLEQKEECMGGRDEEYRKFEVLEGEK